MILSLYDQMANCRDSFPGHMSYFHGLPWDVRLSYIESLPSCTFQRLEQLKDKKSVRSLYDQLVKHILSRDYGPDAGPFSPSVVAQRSSALVKLVHYG